MDKKFIEDRLNDQLIKITLSNPRKKTELHKKVVIKPFIKDDTLFFQFEKFTSTQIFHYNYLQAEATDILYELIADNVYKQMDGSNTEEVWHALFNKKGKSTIKTKVTDNANQPQLDHNRKKAYILEEGIPVPYLVALGVMTPEGRVVKKRFDKFRQVNRFLEMVDDVIDYLPTDRQLHIIDFGCGRSYLTFALYHYLREIRQLDVMIEGLDLKEKVIQDCNTLAKKCGYDQLNFKHGDIVDYNSKSNIDMVVTLHACNTATDMALHKAVGWQSNVIMSVPCCQHELNGQINCEPLEDIFSYGIIKERVSALFTDAMRANWLKEQHYDVQILEFIDLAHTPKNLLIRAVKNKKDTDTSSVSVPDYSKFDALQSYLGSDLTIRKFDQ